MQQHPGLNLDQWTKLSLPEQMANIGSEIERAISWREKKNKEYSEKANLRALELLSLTIKGAKSFPQIKEVARVREAWLDYFVGKNQFKQTKSQWRKYFMNFNYLARTKRT